MKKGIPVVVQGALAHEGWVGRADILRRVESPSALGDWSYEAIDTKLARETRAGAVLQLCVYSDLLSKMQGLAPEYMYVVAPWSDFEPQQYRFADYAAYLRKVKRGLLESLGGQTAKKSYPDPVEHCDICRWRDNCDKRRRDDERAGLSGLAFVGVTGGTTKAPIHRYKFPPQETELRGGEDLCNLGGDKLGKVEAISFEDCTVDIKKRQDTAGIHPEAVFAHKYVDTQVMKDSLVRIGEYVAEHSLGGEGCYQAARDLLLKEIPRTGRQPLHHAGETTVEAAVRLCGHLRGGILPIQGPPGAGKTFTGAQMICELVRQGKTVGITANSHKVIRNLIEAVIKAADENGVALQCCHKADEVEEPQHRLSFAKSSEDLIAALGTTVNVGGGTAWLWSRADAFETVDALFVDEAAQMSLANVLAVSQAAKTVVLIGDPQQLDQPMQGSHPDGTDVSALDHILAGEHTIAADKGLFLEETWRLHPDICAYTSELFYDGKLSSRAGLEEQKIKGAGPISGSGLRYLPVEHQGNQNCSPEEAEAVSRIVKGILDGKATWVDRHGDEKPATLEDILIITPYNAQVFEIQQRLPGARVGTVDKFQGQEAPIAIYSTATSSYADAPRGMEFLYSLNRLNVATSRARCISIMVSSPQIFEAECHTPRQIRLANAFCRYLEMAEVIEPILGQQM